MTSDRNSVTVTGPPRLDGITVDMSQISDTVMTLACIAPYAQSSTTIENIGHIRSKESDRISALADGLSRLGVSFNETPTSLTIHPSVPRGAVIDSYEDHRIAMAFAVAGLATPGSGHSGRGLCYEDVPTASSNCWSCCIRLRAEWKRRRTADNSG